MPGAGLDYKGVYASELSYRTHEYLNFYLVLSY